MGKVVKAIAVIAVSAAIAAFAPSIGLAALHLFGSSAVVGSAAALAAGAVAAVGLSAAAGLVFSAFSAAPHTSTALGQQPSRGQPCEQVNFKWQYPTDPAVRETACIREKWWRDKLFLPGERFAVQRLQGNCMAPVIATGQNWTVIDRDAPIHAGDLVLFRPDDIADYLRRSGLDPNWSAGLVKRFVGIDPDQRVIVYETTNPPNRMQTGLCRVQHLYRVHSVHRSWRAAWRSRIWSGIAAIAGGTSCAS